MKTDLLALSLLTLAGASLCLLHAALALRAFRGSFLGGLACLVVPLGAPIFALRSGARGAAAAYVSLALVYGALLAFATV